MRSWRKGRGPTISGTVEVTTDADFEVEVSELTDDELNYCIDEARKRGLLGAAKLGSRRDRLAGDQAGAGDGREEVRCQIRSSTTPVGQ